MIAIVDYRMGNLRSVENALRRLGAEFCVTADADTIRSADRVMCRHTEEGDADCIGLFDTHVRRFVASEDVKVPHMGWNRIGNLESKLFKGMQGGEYVYFVHSYYPELCPDTIATAVHGVMFSAALKYENFYGTQFHPEKSWDAGEKIIENFLKL